MNWTAWCSAIGRPNATRSSAHARASSISRSAAPQQRAAIISRSSANQRRAASSPPARLARAAVGDHEAEPVGRLAALLLDRRLGEHRKTAAAPLVRDAEVGEAGVARTAAKRGHHLGAHLAAVGDLLLERVKLLLDEAAR